MLRLNSTQIPPNTPVDLVVPALAPLLAVAWWSYSVLCQQCSTNVAELVVTAEVAVSPFDTRPEQTLVCERWGCWNSVYQSDADVVSRSTDPLTREVAEAVTGLDLTAVAA